ncbi:MAG TPA: glutaredoxin domain-containing protein [Myxococcota bacterium]|nr:glutaredoxin domain-containing protein [Myxococcota bacterium]HRY97018.1 glutaredoxin domain-containing protein [Myxococcota bacterium]HSA21175.1 glutaredoxin domain-containing protein [Myxococcota bacterium]
MQLARLHRGIALGLLGLGLACLPGCDTWNELTGGQGTEGGAGAGSGAVAAKSGGASQGADGKPAGSPGQAGGEELTASDRQLRGAMEGVYKYTDSAGVIHFVDSPEKIPPRYRKQAVHPTGGAITVLPSSPIDEILEKEKIDPASYAQKPGAAAPKHGQVVLYTTSWCPHCTRARDHLQKRGVSFAEKDIERDRAALEEMLRKTGGSRGVPVLDIHGTILRGFSPQSVDRALAR